MRESLTGVSTDRATGLARMRNSDQPIALGDVAQRSAANLVYNAASALWPMVLALAVTPLMLRELGEEQYGLWAIVGAVSGLIGVFQFGLGDATVKYVSEHHAKGDLRRAGHYVQVTLLFYLISGSLAATALALLAPWLAGSIFDVPFSLQPVARVAFWIAALSVGLTFITGSIAAVPSALQRYDITSKIDLSLRTAWYAAIVVLLLVGGGLLAVLLATLAQNVLRLLLLWQASRHLWPGLRIAPGWVPGILRELLLGYGIWSLLLSLGGILFSQVDRLLVGYFLGVSNVPYYVVPDSLAIRVHGLLAATMVFVFPLTSALAGTGQGVRLSRVFSLGFRFVALCASILLGPLAILAPPILALWVGDEFAVRSSTVLQLQSYHYFLTSLNIVPFFVLNGLGKIRINALFSITHVFLLPLLYAIMIRHFGILGPPLTNLFYTLVVMIIYMFVTGQALRGESGGPLNLAKLLLVAILPPLIVFGLDAAWFHWSLSISSVFELALAFGCYGTAIGGLGLLLDWGTEGANKLAIVGLEVIRRQL